MASVAEQTVHTGNTVAIFIGAKEIGRAQSLTADRDFGTENVYEIGNYMPQESVYLKYSGKIQMKRVRMRKGDLVDAGFAPLGEDVLKMGVLTITVHDKENGNSILESYQGCSITTYNTEYNANEFVSEQVEFTYLTASKGA